VRFFLELAMLAALAVAGYQLPGPRWQGIALMLAAPAGAAATWGLFVSPKARVHVPWAPPVLLELLLFGAAAGGLAVAGYRILGAALFVAALASRAAKGWFDRHEEAASRPAH
jgi:hypothetical protein